MCRGGDEKKKQSERQDAATLQGDISQETKKKERKIERRMNNEKTRDVRDCAHFYSRMVRFSDAAGLPVGDGKARRDPSRRASWSSSRRRAFPSPSCAFTCTRSLREKREREREKG